MATMELPDTTSLNTESSQLPCSRTKRKLGGWITFPFISGSLMGMSIAQSGVIFNLIVYLIQEYNVKSIDATQIYNIINGCMSVAPVAGAIIADSYFGCFSVVAVTTFASFWGTVLLVLTATVDSLRPPNCLPESSVCPAASVGQATVLYLSVALLSIGAGGTRFTTATLGAHQFTRPNEHDVFFNWYFFVSYLTSMIGATVIVYVEDSVSWGVGFGLCAVANALSFVSLMAGIKYCRLPKPEGSPFTVLARVVVAAARKHNMVLSSEKDDYYCGQVSHNKVPLQPSPRLRFLNKAALKSEGDTCSDDGLVMRPWRLCSVQQVEDFKTIVAILPLWSTAILLGFSIAIQLSLTVLQALTMDRSIGRHFNIPAGSLSVAWLAAVAIVLPFLDRAIFPVFHRLTGHNLTPLQRIGAGHIFNTTALATSALVERRRLTIVHEHGLVDDPNSVVPMTVLWLVLPLAMTGLGEALHFPGQVSFYYQEFPKTLRNTSTGMIALIIAIGYYLSTAIVDLVKKVTNWLPDNINVGRMDNVYWLLAIVGTLNFGYYLLCASLYKFRDTAEEEEDIAVEEFRSLTPKV